jgi:hypothetical protein
LSQWDGRRLPFPGFATQLANLFNIVRIMKLASLFFASLFCPGIALAELKWDRQRVELAPSALENSVDAIFGFVNAGTQPVTIEKLTPSCGCTTASLAKMTIDPGERSQIVARFDITGRRGVQTKTVTVHIKDEKEPVILTLTVTISDLLKIDPPLVAWEQGEAGKPKTVSLRAFEALPVKVVNVVSSETRFTAKLETVRENGEYVIVVTPDTTATPGFAVLSFDVEARDQKKSLRAYAQVKGTPQ